MRVLLGGGPRGVSYEAANVWRNQVTETLGAEGIETVNLLQRFMVGEIDWRDESLIDAKLESCHALLVYDVGTGEATLLLRDPGGFERTFPDLDAACGWLIDRWRDSEEGRYVISFL